MHELEADSTGIMIERHHQFGDEFHNAIATLQAEAHADRTNSANQQRGGLLKRVR